MTKQLISIHLESKERMTNEKKEEGRRLGFVKMREEVIHPHLRVFWTLNFFINEKLEKERIK